MEATDTTEQVLKEWYTAKRGIIRDDEKDYVIASQEHTLDIVLARQLRVISHANITIADLKKQQPANWEVMVSPVAPRSVSRVTVVVDPPNVSVLVELALEIVYALVLKVRLPIEIGAPKFTVPAVPQNTAVSLLALFHA